MKQTIFEILYTSSHYRILGFSETDIFAWTAFWNLIIICLASFLSSPSLLYPSLAHFQLRFRSVPPVVRSPFSAHVIQAREGETLEDVYKDFTLSQLPSLLPSPPRGICANAAVLEIWRELFGQYYWQIQNWSCGEMWFFQHLNELPSPQRSQTT